MTPSDCQSHHLPQPPQAAVGEAHGPSGRRQVAGQSHSPSAAAVGHGIAASIRTISLATACSRILGFLRDLLIAQLFGTGTAAQAFVVAFRLPNMLRDLVGEGAMTSAIVPVFSATRATRSREEFWRVVQASCVKVVAAVGLLGLSGVVLAPGLVRLIAPGFVGDAEKFALTVRLTRVLFPFIVLVSGWAFLGGVLNTLREFLIPALGPIILNLVMIAACLWIVPRLAEPVMGLAIAVLAGGIAQLLVQLPTARRLGFRWRWRWHEPGAREIVTLLVPRLLGTAVYQASVVLDTILASLSIAGMGAVAALYFATRLVQLPLALFATASAQASLPTLAERAAVKDLATFRDTVLGVVRLVLCESLPAAVGLIVLAAPIVHVCFARGAFDQHSAALTAQALGCLAVGLIGYGVNKVLTGAFYALKDTRTPVRLAFEALCINGLLAIALLPILHVGGLALAASLSSLLNAWRLLRALQRRLGQPLLEPLLEPLLRIGASAGLMGAACAAAWTAVDSRLPPIAALGGVIGLGLVTYVGAGLLFKVEDITKLLRWIAARRRSSSSA